MPESEMNIEHLLGFHASPEGGECGMSGVVRGKTEQGPGLKMDVINVLQTNQDLFTSTTANEGILAAAKFGLQCFQIFL